MCGLVTDNLKNIKRLFYRQFYSCICLLLILFHDRPHPMADVPCWLAKSSCEAAHKLIEEGLWCQRPSLNWCKNHIVMLTFGLPHQGSLMPGIEPWSPRGKGEVWCLGAGPMVAVMCELRAGCPIWSGLPPLQTRCDISIVITVNRTEQRTGERERTEETSENQGELNIISYFSMLDPSWGLLWWKVD